MTKAIIDVRGVSKRYRLGAAQQYQTLRDALAATVRSPLKRLHARRAGETIWALRDVTFRVEPGEVLGIVGRNGAGKSTLLKVLARITEPTTGRVELYGRVGSLLEVGTGFHPELTGRENVFLNGAILGMRRAEIVEKFNEIVAFAELEKFVDTPVKHYSSGMYVRLAFAVAAYLDPDILIVDEVLAVGDAAFQKRCLGKMHDVTRQGRTVLFVSHNMAAVKSLCDRALLMEAGRIAREGEVNGVVDAYLAAGSELGGAGFVPDDMPRSGTGEVRVRRVELLDASGEPLAQVYFGQAVRVALTLEVTREVEDAAIGVAFSTLDGVRFAASFNIDGGRPPARLAAGWHSVSVDLDVTLLPRLAAVDVLIFRLHGPDIDVVQSALRFEALGVAEGGEDHYRWSTVHGFVRMGGRWQVAEAEGGGKLPAREDAA